MQTRANTVSKTRGLEDFVEKNAEHGAKCRLDSFAGCRPRYLKFPSLGGTHGANRFKSSDWEDPKGKEIAALDGRLSRGGIMALTFFWALSSWLF